MKSFIKIVYKIILPKSIRTAIWYRRYLNQAYPKGVISSIMLHEGYNKRIDIVAESPDNKFIRRVPDAGCIEKNYITMHNGVKVTLKGYYGDFNACLLTKNKGVHEPQEERIFEDIIKTLPERCTMLELGSYWSFYSLSLLNIRPKAKCHMIEPDLKNLISGKTNFRLNGRKGSFLRSFVGSSSKKKPKTICVDNYCNSKSIHELSILHSDIQGAELEVLHGAQRMLDDKLIDYLFVSTHEEQLHRDCVSFLQSKGYKILEQANLSESYSLDGLIVAIKPTINFELGYKISLRKQN